MTLKLGGIPFFEEYYKKEHISNSNLESICNPQTPQEDFNEKYSWRIVSVYSVIDEGETITQQISGSSLFLARRVRN